MKILRSMGRSILWLARRTIAAAAWPFNQAAASTIFSLQEKVSLLESSITIKELEISQLTKINQRNEERIAAETAKFSSDIARHEAGADYVRLARRAAE